MSVAEQITRSTILTHICVVMLFLTLVRINEAVDYRSTALFDHIMMDKSSQSIHSPRVDEVDLK